MRRRHVLDLQPQPKNSPHQRFFWRQIPSDAPTHSWRLTSLRNVLQTAMSMKFKYWFATASIHSIELSQSIFRMSFQTDHSLHRSIRECFRPLKTTSRQITWSPQWRHVCKSTVSTELVKCVTTPSTVQSQIYNTILLLYKYNIYTDTQTVLE